MSMLAAVVDDEPLARMRLKRLLEMHDVQVVAEGENGAQAIEIIEQNNIDILFIDINMPVMNGLDAVRRIDASADNGPAVVFCTAYDEYAIDAFRTNAIAYLLKPFDLQELKAALQKAKRVSRLQLGQLKDSQTLEKTLTVHRRGILQSIPMSEIVYFYSNQKNIFAVFKDGLEVLVDQTLIQLEEQFEGDVVRIHRGYLVNRRQILKLYRHENQSKIELESLGKSLVVSRRHLAEVKQCFR
ncbi:MAG: two-component system response regulator AlgR [Arenicella sp.]|jgi:two-component system response regulator AlgR